MYTQPRNDSRVPARALNTGGNAWGPGAPTERRAGVALILVIFVGITLMMLAAVSVQMSLVHGVTRTVQEQVFLARQIADSGLSQALVRIREGGVVRPMSGGGTTPVWVSFSEGSFFYSTTYDVTTSTSIVRAWGRVAANPYPSTCMESPDSSTWDGTGWVLRGSEVVVRSVRFIPETPVYMGNGGIEQPLGGFYWGAGVDPSDPSTWIQVTSSPSSYQASTVPFHVSALDHPYDYLYNGGTPTPASSNPHPYKVFASQNAIGQFNVEAWFKDSAGAGIDPTISVEPPPTSAYFDTTDSKSPDYPYPIDPEIPDVQSFSWELWNKYKDSPSATHLVSGSHSGTYGDLANPAIVFATGTLGVSSGSSFSGAGILVIRDDYDPNASTSNTPSTKALLDIDGQFKWTGLVMIAGWAPSINVSSTADATIVGALFGEDSVQSGGEVSLDSATITLLISGTLDVLYSNALFSPGGLLYEFLPFVRKEVISIRDI